MKKKVLLLSLFQANGGIASWSKKFIKTFDSDKYCLVPVDRSTGLSVTDGRIMWKRIVYGLIALHNVMKSVKKVITNNDIAILHTTTSGGLMGTIRDNLIAKICYKSDIKRVMHCRYGCITEDLHNGIYGKFLRKTMARYNQIWVLDNRSANTIMEYPELRDKVFITPNSIAVSENMTIAPKSYKHIAFIANLVPSKGLFELIEAFKRVDDKGLTLSIVGEGSTNVLEKLKETTSGYDNIRIVGLLPNDEAVRFMQAIDIVALPTYMPQEAFPISILEAMSLGKLVISTRHAAIGDILTGLDGNPCGYFVREQSVEDIVKAIKWCTENSDAADELCRKAYDKVYNCYRMEVVYNLYISLYDKLLK